jgi:hypothetical protein
LKGKAARVDADGKDIASVLERVDKSVLAGTGRFVGLNGSLKFGRPRWPYCSQTWCPNNRAYIVELEAYAPATSMIPFEGYCRVYIYPKGGSLEPLPSYNLPSEEMYEEGEEPPPHSAKTIENIGSKYDLVIVGKGLGALRAAVEAVSYGLRVLILDDGATGFDLASSLWGDKPLELLMKLGEGGRALALEYSAYLGWYDEGHVIYHGDRLLVYPLSKPVIYATSFASSPPIAENNDLPGIIAAEYALELLSLGYYKPKRIAVIGCSYPGRLLAEHAAQSGIEVTVVKPRWWRECYVPASVSLVEAESLKFHGHGRVEAVEIDGETVSVDIVASALPPLPDALPAYAAGYRMLYCKSGTIVPELPDPEHLPGRIPLILAGESLGEAEPRAVEASAVYAATLAAVYAGKASIEDARAALQDYITVSGRRGCSDGVVSEKPPQLLYDEIGGFKFIDMDEDVTLETLLEVWRSGYRSLEMVKRITGLGMGLDQGRISVPMAMMAISHLERVPISALEPPKPRPPLTLPYVGFLSDLEV